MNEALLQSTRAFWNANPCGVAGSFAAVRAQRYAMEPWIPGVLREIAANHRSVAEIGCGQGIDAIELCRAMAHDGQYVGLDYSERSIETAKAHAADIAASLSVRPRYMVGNAEALDFADNSFEAVYSIGVLHHTADEFAAVREIHRILRPAGTAYVALYRKPAPKVAVAQGLRAMQKGLDRLLHADRCLYAALRRVGASERFGTMFLECFGVPYLKWYTRDQINSLFRDFAMTEMTAVGANLGRLVGGSVAPSRLGYLWLIRARKSGGAPSVGETEGRGGAS